MQSVQSKHISAYPHLKLKTYGKETLLFHCGTGETILLHPHVAPLISLLKRCPNPVIVSGLIEQLAEIEGFEIDDDFSIHVVSLVNELIRREVLFLS